MCIKLVEKNKCVYKACSENRKGQSQRFGIQKAQKSTIIELELEDSVLKIIQSYQPWDVLLPSTALLPISHLATNEGKSTLNAGHSVFALLSVLNLNSFLVFSSSPTQSKSNKSSLHMKVSQIIEYSYLVTPEPFFFFMPNMLSFCPSISFNCFSFGLGCSSEQISVCLY